MPSSSFGSWYDEQKAAENGGSSNSSWFSIDSEQALPLFNSENLPGFSMESMRETMEASMPKKILGMGYQQRFKVNYLSRMLVKSPAFVGRMDVPISRVSAFANTILEIVLCFCLLLHRSFVHFCSSRRSFSHLLSLWAFQSWP